MLSARTVVSGTYVLKRQLEKNGAWKVLGRPWRVDRTMMTLLNVMMPAR